MVFAPNVVFQPIGDHDDSANRADIMAELISW
jgi:hypothetical protein